MNKEKRKSKIGGQALIEGIMMRGLDKVSMAVRLPNKKIDIETWQVDSLVHPKWYRKIPIIRGVVGMVSSLILGYKCLMKSAEKATTEEQNDSNNKNIAESNSALIKIAGTIGTILALLISIGLFMFIPAFAIKSVDSALNLNQFSKSLLEGIFKIAIFIGY